MNWTEGILLIVGLSAVITMYRYRHRDMSALEITGVFLFTCMPVIVGHLIARVWFL